MPGSIQEGGGPYCAMIAIGIESQLSRLHWMGRRYWDPIPAVTRRQNAEENFGSTYGIMARQLG